MAIIPSGYSQVNLVFVGDNLPTGAEVTFGVDNNGAIPDLVCSGVFDALSASTLMSNFVDDCAIVTIRAKNGPNADGPFSEISVNMPGGIASAGATPNVAALFKKNTDLGGRKGQGRCFWPGVSEALVGSDGTLDSTLRAAIQTDANSLLSGLVSETLPMVLLHNDATTPSPVIGFTIQSVAATQRRRLRR